ncbi:O-methyltransferase family 3 protein [Stereum hirsutum FP-91666 SS1]|uniref:O-methyltransferase family 3 protein n=1 Tax=Stereum hirsutum (strain FP-91666) TaxID=721885 RepID=UPI000444A14E|nr:O-methyltransferase family 3 protein [Stereum hirsutum FP-91666 SS1]EIM83286.1 O-methyltransferase family 3 protein [Stereum hirsutum FP-91666 SS1]
MSRRDTTVSDWAHSDTFHNSFLLPPDSTLDAALENTKKNDVPAIEVSRAQGKFLYLIARSIGAKRVLEVGTLGGFSATWFARALPEDGKVVTCELEPKHAEVARQNLITTGVSSKVDIVLGPAVETLANMPTPPESELFDLAFIDADKENNLNYFLQAKRLVRKGGVIIVDNVVRNGNVADESDTSGSSVGVRKLLDHLKEDKEVEATTIATVGHKGYDGFLYAWKL